MCRLFGFRSAVPSKAHRSLILARNSLSHQAQQHRHGWGIGHYRGDQPEVLTGLEAACDSLDFREASARLSARTFVVHVRRATVGRIGTENLHPFVYGRWMFAHNGTIHGFDRARPWLRARGLPGVEPQGATDSEVLFLYLLGELARAGLGAGAEAGEIAAALHGALDRLEAEIASYPEIAERSALNFLMTDGELFIGNRRGRELWFSTQKEQCADALTCPEVEKPCLLRVRPHDRVNHLLIASEPIGEEDAWEEVPDRSIVMVDARFRLQQVYAAPHGLPERGVSSCGGDAGAARGRR